VISTRANWIKENKITVLMQLSLDKHPDLPNVPLITELAKTDEQRALLRLIFARQALGRPFLAPPDVPADRVAALRQAFMDTMKDKAFLADAEKAQLEITPVSGDAVQKLVAEIYQTPAEIVKKAAEILK
jgi:tripartite-type tricarboxylate transporter receptor subunit TctC